MNFVGLMLDVYACQVRRLHSEPSLSASGTTSKRSTPPVPHDPSVSILPRFKTIMSSTYDSTERASRERRADPHLEYFEAA